MQCRLCGTELPIEAAHCPNCGAVTPYQVSASGVSPYDLTTTSPASSTPPQAPANGSGSPLNGVPQQNPYAPVNPYEVPQLPPPPPPLQRRGNRTWLIVGTIVLVCVIVVGGVVALLRSGGQGSSSTPSPTIAPAQATATAQARTTATATSTLTATAQANATATASVTAANSNPYPPGGGTLALNDSLMDSSSSTWIEGSGNSGGTCQFTKGAYHISQPNVQSAYFCSSPNSDFSNFVFEVQMTIIKGDCGGIFFRADNTTGKFYSSFVCADGTYALGLYTGSFQVKPLKNFTLSGAINRGLNQTNLIAVGADGSTITLYINHQQIFRVNDSAYSHGQIGLFANPTSHPTEVAFSNVKVWTL